MKQKISMLVLVAPWAITDKNTSARRAFYEHPIDPTIKDQVETIIYFTSDNEDPDGKESLRMIHEMIGGKIIELPGKGHYTFRDMHTVEFPELIEQVIPGCLS